LKIRSGRRSGRKLALMLILLGTASAFNAVRCQETRTINLHDAIQTALDSSLAVKSAGLSVDVQKALKGAAVDLPKTAIDGQYGQYNSYSNDNGFTVSQTFAFPTVYINKYKLANANIQSSEWQHTASRLEIATRVKQSYWQYVYLLAKQKLLSYQDSLYSVFSRAAELRSGREKAHASK